ncbi:P-loop containing nucleoside triphosphate hydrolase protein [Xylariaceae sp. FL0804]|nr:P-loop containing nucleoside triphosphate hydrolase protein [Xylariaceae sp. FL0804]
MMSQKSNFGRWFRKSRTKAEASSTESSAGRGDAGRETVLSGSTSEELRILRSTAEDRMTPIVFVAHSMGGLVVKLAINMAHTNHERHEDILTNTKGCIFLAVPFRGADVAWWAQNVSLIARALSFGRAGNSSFTGALTRNSNQWMKISRDFVHRGKEMTFRSGYETERLSGILVVDEASVRHNIPNEEVFPVPGSNHRTISKFGDEDEQRFAPVGLAVKEVVEAAVARSASPASSSVLPLTSELPVAVKTFFGRQSQLQELSRMLDPAIGKKKGVVLYGIGGSGKTQLALRHVEQNRESYRAVVWINVATAELAVKSFTDAALMMRHSWSSKDLPNPYAGGDDRAFVRSRLRSTLHRNWLLVLDSADDLDDMNLLQMVPDCQHGSIMITSTKKEASDILSGHGFESMEVDRLDDRSANDLLLHKAQVEDTPSAKGNLVLAITRELNGLPIALEQAGLLLRKRILTFDNFVSEYRANYRILMDPKARPGHVLHEKQRSINVILSMLYSYIVSVSCEAAKLLEIMASMGPSSIPISFLCEVTQTKADGSDNLPEVSSLHTSPASETPLRIHLSLLEDSCLVKIKRARDSAWDSAIVHGAICQWLTNGYESRIKGLAVSVASATCYILCHEKRDLDWSFSPPLSAMD